MTETQAIQERIGAMDSALSDKGYLRPECDITIRASDLYVWVRCDAPGEITNVFESVEGETITSALDAADAFISKMDRVEDYQKRDAVKQFGRAVDAMRTAGFEADFIDPIAEQLKVISDNLLTDQRQAGQ